MAKGETRHPAEKSRKPHPEKPKVKRLDVAAPLGYSVDARLRVITGRKTAMTGDEAFPPKISIASHVEENADGLRNAYEGVQNSWNQEREKVTTTRENWGMNAAKATLRLFYTHRENPENIALLQTVFHNWGITVDGASLQDPARLEREVGLVADAFSGKFYEEYCGVDQSMGVSALERAFVLGMDTDYIKRSGKYGKNAQEADAEKFYADAQGQGESSERMQRALQLLDPFLARYFGTEQLYTAFQLCLASEITVRSSQLYPKSLTVSKATASEEEALKLIAEHMPNEKPSLQSAMRVSEDFLTRRDDNSPSEANQENQDRPKHTFAQLQHDMGVLGIPVKPLGPEERVQPSVAAQLMESLHQHANQLETDGFEKPVNAFMNGPAVLDAIKVAPSPQEQVGFLYQETPLVDMVVHHYTQDYLAYRQQIFDILHDGGGLDTSDEKLISLAHHVGKDITSLSFAIAWAESQPAYHKNEAYIRIFRSSQFAQDIERFGGIGILEQKAITLMTRSMRKFVGEDLPANMTFGNPLSPEDAEAFLSRLVEKGQLPAGIDRQHYLNRLKAMPMAYDQLSCILTLLKKNQERAFYTRRDTLLVSDTEVEESPAPDWLVNGNEADPFSYFGAPPPAV